MLIFGSAIQIVVYCAEHLRRALHGSVFERRNYGHIARPRCKLLCRMGPWGRFVDNISSKLAFYPPQPPSYSIKQHEDAQREYYIQPYSHSDVKVLQCEVSKIPTARLQKGSPKPEEIVAAFVPFKRQGQTVRPTVLFSHGNAVDVGQMLPFYRDLSRELQCNVLGYDYTGYGCSSGEPSVAGTLADIEAVYGYLQSHYGKRPEDIVLYGQSVGSGPTGHLAAREPRLAGVVMHSALMSGLRVLKPGIKWWPSWADCYNNLKLVPQIACPVLVLHVPYGKEIPLLAYWNIFHPSTIHPSETPPYFIPRRNAGTDDDVVDICHGRRLHSLARHPSQPFFLQGYTHDNIESSSGYMPTLQRFMTEIFGADVRY